MRRDEILRAKKILEENSGLLPSNGILFFEISRDKVEETDTLDFNRSSKINSGYANLVKPGLIVSVKEGTVNIYYGYARVEYSTNILISDVIKDLQELSIDFKISDSDIDVIKSAKIIEEKDILVKYYVYF